MNTYSSKYPSIVVDKSNNSVNESLKKAMTVEEYYDIKHHTHNMSSLPGYNEMQDTIRSLTKMIDTLKSTIDEQQITINNLNDAIKGLTDLDIDAIKSLKEEIANMASVSDWDVETPGIQDMNGNDLGEFMGFQMTEIIE